MEKALVVRGRRENASLHGFRGQTLVGSDIGRPRGTGVDALQPLGGLMVQVGTVGEVASGQEVALDEPDQAFVATFLVRHLGRTRFGMEAELRRELEQGRVSDRLNGFVTSRGDEAAHQSPREHLLAHILGPANPHPPSVFEPIG